jgi:hypothetical protein
MRLPLDEAPPKIGYQTRRGLVPVFRVLGKEPHDDGGQGLGNLAAIQMGYCRAWRYRLTCDVAVDPFQRVGRNKREHAGEHLVQGDA